MTSQKCSDVCVRLITVGHHKTMTIADVHRLFGEAAHWSSILEEQLWNICVLNERVVGQATHDNSTAKILKKFQRMEVGRLIAKIKEILGKDLEGKVDTIFRPALKMRNRLIHDFFIDHHEILTNSEEIPAAIAELNEIKNTIFPAADFATKACRELCALYTSGTEDAQSIIPPDLAHKGEQSR